MPNKRQQANLRRGGVAANADTAARARAAKAKRKTDDDATAFGARSDPWGAIEQMHDVMTRHITQLLRDEQRGKEQPSREVTDRLREYRQTTQSLVEYRTTRRGVIDDAKVFFEELDQRLATLMGEDYDEKYAMPPTVLNWADEEDA